MQRGNRLHWPPRGLNSKLPMFLSTSNQQRRFSPMPSRLHSISPFSFFNKMSHKTTSSLLYVTTNFFPYQPASKLKTQLASFLITFAMNFQHRAVIFWIIMYCKKREFTRRMSQEVFVNLLETWTKRQISRHTPARFYFIC